MFISFVAKTSDVIITGSGRDMCHLVYDLTNERDDNSHVTGNDVAFLRDIIRTVYGAEWVGSAWNNTTIPLSAVSDTV